MNTTRTRSELVDARRVALLLGVTVGLGILVHQSFFVLAGAIAVGALAVATARTIQEHSDSAHLVRHHR
jgi:4-amino-4-deoxy-L-arabinose transferase-like glycosyltransferase